MERVIQANGCGSSTYPVGLYDISKILKQPKPVLVQGFPDHVFICSTDVLADRCHTALWLGCSQRIWHEACEWYATFCTECAFDKKELLHKFRMELLQMQGPDFKPSVEGAVSEYHNKLLIKTCAVFKAHNPKSPIGELYALRCGPNQLEVLAQAIAPRRCVACDGVFATDLGNDSQIDVSMWKGSGNCKCESVLYCKRCMMDYVDQHKTQIGPQYLVKCPGCAKPVLCGIYVTLKAALDYERDQARAHEIVVEVLAQIQEEQPDLTEEQLVALVNSRVQARVEEEGLNVGVGVTGKEENL